MSDTTQRPPPAAPAPEQVRYARVLDVTAKAGFAVLVVGFVAYLFGWLEEHVTAQELPRLWSLPLAEYLVRTDTPTGWGWIVHLHKGEFAGLAGIALLAGSSGLCLAAVIPIYLWRGERAYALICTLVILVLLLAGSGILTTGH
ncbi:MAG: hypothetical protein U1F58_01510 [Burkholderiales bacterium]